MKIISIGAALSGLGVILGAFGAHGLRGNYGADLIDIYETGSHYLMIHALGIVLYGLWRESKPEAQQPKCWPAALFLLGMILFTGSLYTITFTGFRGFGAITPIGGVCFILGWLGFAMQASRGQAKKA
jgi:uncharacterized membrane protein YgdD (TMEM256/DUF423 family)